MKCPVCGESVRKAEKFKNDDLLIRCRTDGDFVITPGAMEKIDQFPVSLRQKALNRAIFAAKSGELPRIRKSLISESRSARAISAGDLEAVD